MTESINAKLAEAKRKGEGSFHFGPVDRTSELNDSLEVVKLLVNQLAELEQRVKHLESLLNVEPK